MTALILLGVAILAVVALIAGFGVFGVLVYRWGVRDGKEQTAGPQQPDGLTAVMDALAQHPVEPLTIRIPPVRVEQPTEILRPVPAWPAEQPTMRRRYPLPVRRRHQ